MEDILLLDTIERYLNNQMLPEERVYFEQLRKNTPEIDQMVVEHKLFLHQMDEFSANNNLKQLLHTAHNSLAAKGDIYEGGNIPVKGKIIQLFHKYKRVTAIAASIAGITALAISGIVAYITPAVNNSQLLQLSRAVDQVKHNQQEQGAKLNEIKSSVKDYNFTTSGTAFLIDGKGYLVTNAHVLKGTGAVVVNKGNEYSSKIVYIDNQKDLAILKIDDKDFKPVTLPYGIKRTDMDLGEEIFTLGYPREDVVYSKGYLSALSGYNGDTSSYQFSINANPGNSGGPIFNKNGDVVGILSNREMQAEGVVFAIKAENIFRMVNELKKSDTTIQKIKLSSASHLKYAERTEQIKQIQDYVYEVKAYNQK
jgi:S1-C subfamily serine protease